MSATKLWYPHYIRDFNAKTGHLSLAERGAYRALMDAYWERGGPLPNDERALCRMIGAFPDEWESVRSNVLPFFEDRDGLLHHHRIDEELASAKAKHKAKVDSIARARSAIRTENSADARPDDSLANGHATGQETGTHNTKTPSPKESELPSSLNPARTKNGNGGFDIEMVLGDKGREAARKAAPGWDLHYLFSAYNASFETRGPPKFPDKAFPAWCAKYTKGKSLRRGI